MNKFKKNICLCMIVKDEAKIIERCLNSAKSIIDYVSICDTGSTDHTPEIINKWCNDNNIPGTVHYEQFKNFGYNRTLAVSLAQKTYPDADYLLLLDADMILEDVSDFDKFVLDKDHYLTMQSNGKIKYWLTRLLKTSLPWESVGVTHEYWDIDYSKLGTKRIITMGKLDTLIVDDHEDGGSKTDKFERDKRLLLEGIQDPETPDFLTTRYLFYLAQTYMCLEEFEESIKWYKKRVEAGGWEEEVFLSLLHIGLCYEQLANLKSNEVNIISEVPNANVLSKERTNLEHEQFSALSNMYLQKAWEFRPNRAESLYHLARIHRIKSDQNLGLMYALQGKEIAFPDEDILFIDYHVYDYLFDYEISICANYIKSKFEIGQAAQKHLESIIDQLPDHIRRSVISNSKFYP